MHAHARTHARSAIPCRGSSTRHATRELHPKPREVATQAVVLHDEEGGLTWRRADDATEAGAGAEHQRFIFSNAIGVQ